MFVICSMLLLARRSLPLQGDVKCRRLILDDYSFGLWRIALVNKG